MGGPDDLLALRYALGVAEMHEIVAAEVRYAQDQEFAAKVDLYDQAVEIFEPIAPLVKPSSDVWARIDAAISDDKKSPYTRTVRANAMSWERVAPGVERKLLHLDKAAGASSVLYRFAPGSEVPAHPHQMVEECLVLEGEVELDGVSVNAGDFHLAFSGTRHGALTSRTGAVVFLRGDLAPRF